MSNCLNWIQPIGSHLKKVFGAVSTTSSLIFLVHVSHNIFNIYPGWVLGYMQDSMPSVDFVGWEFQSHSIPWSNLGSCGIGDCPVFRSNTDLGAKFRARSPWTVRGRLCRDPCRDYGLCLWSKCRVEIVSIPKSEYTASPNGDMLLRCVK